MLLQDACERVIRRQLYGFWYSPSVSGRALTGPSAALLLGLPDETPQRHMSTSGRNPYIGRLRMEANKEGIKRFPATDAFDRA